VDKDMRVLVTGHRGFIGSNAVKRLSEIGMDVVGYEWGDVGVDIETFDHVMHFGAISSTVYDNVEQLMLQNYTFTKMLINQCSSNNIPIQISSSASVYGIHNRTFKESDPCAPRNYYSFSKYLVEEYCNNREFNTQVQLFRYFNVYGPGEDHKGEQASPYHKFTKQALAGEVTIFENSDQYVRDFIHVNDVINYHLSFMDIKESGIWNIGTGQVTSFEEVANKIATAYNASIKVIPMPERLKTSYQTYTKADMTKTWDTLGK